MRPQIFGVTLLCLALTSCGHHRFGARHHYGGEDLVIGLATMIVIAGDRAERARSTRSGDYYVSSASFGPPMPPSPRDHPQTSDSAPFDPQAARIALGDVELSSCREAENPPKFGHAKVTFEPSGRISKVVVDAPSGLTESSAKCIGERIGAATVRPFRGGPIVVGTSFRTL